MTFCLYGGKNRLLGIYIILAANIYFYFNAF